MTNYSLLLEQVIDDIWFGQARDTSLRARLKDAKVNVPHDMPGIKRKLFDSGAQARGGIIKNGKLFW